MDTQKIAVRDKVMDLESLSEVTLVKQFDFTPVATAQEALTLLGNDSAKFMAIVNQGLLEAQKDAIRADAAQPWHTFAKDAEGEETDVVNGPYTGTPVNMELAGPLVLNFAKMFGFAKDASVEKKREAKAKAWETIKQTPAILEALKPKAA